MIFSRKAQLGKIMASLPLMILIFVIMGIFVFLASSFSLAKAGKESPNFVFGNVMQDDLMSQKISVYLTAKSGEKADMLVIDAIAKNWTNEVMKESICTGAASVIHRAGGNKILFVFSAEDPNPSSLMNTKKVYKPDCYLATGPGGAVSEKLTLLGNSDPAFKIYKDRGVIRSTSFGIRTMSSVRIIYVDYYLGEALS